VKAPPPLTGSGLAEIRYALGKNQHQMAELLGVSLIGLKRFETDARPIPRYIECSARAVELCAERGLLAELTQRLGAQAG
jgi:DNA-binding XRE family transcriptional regulator